MVMTQSIEIHDGVATAREYCQFGHGEPLPQPSDDLPISVLRISDEKNGLTKQSSALLAKAQEGGTLRELLISTKTVEQTKDLKILEEVASLLKNANNPDVCVRLLLKVIDEQMARLSQHAADVRTSMAMRERNARKEQPISQSETFHKGSEPPKYQPK